MNKHRGQELSERRRRFPLQPKAAVRREGFTWFASEEITDVLALSYRFRTAYS